MMMMMMMMMMMTMMMMTMTTTTTTTTMMMMMMIMCLVIGVTDKHLATDGLMYVWSSLPHTGLICNESQQFFSGTIIILDFLTSSSCSAGDSSLTSETSLDEGFVVELRAADIANAVKV